MNTRVIDNLAMRHLESFISIYELKSISNAAARCHISQSAMTKHLQKLENYLGLTLFYRHTRELKPSPAATNLYSYAVDLFSSAMKFQERAENIYKINNQEVKIGIDSLVPQWLCSKLTKEAYTKIPDLSLFLTSAGCESLNEMTNKNEIDFFISSVSGREQTINCDSLISSPLNNIPLVCVRSAEQDVDKHCNWAIPSTLKWHLQKIITQFPDPTTHAIQEIDNIQCCIDLVLEQLAFTIAPKEHVAPYLESGKLVKLPVSDVFYQLSIFRSQSTPLSTTSHKLVEMLPNLVKC